MANIFWKKGSMIGKSPEDLVFVGEQRMERSTIDLIKYDERKIVEISDLSVTECEEHVDMGSVSWFNINGLHDIELIRSLGKSFNLHPLILEDLVHTEQRTRMEEYDNCIYIVTRMLRYDESGCELSNDQISIVIGENYLLTFQESKGVVFEPVRERIRRNRGRIRKVGPDYLAYALLDTIVDNYIYQVERVGEKAEETEDLIIGDPTEELLAKIYENRKEINYLRKTINPAKDLISQLCRSEADNIQETTYPFLKDLLGHITQAYELIYIYHEMLSDQLNVYNSEVSNRLNEIMKVLTVFTAIFIPISFLAGVYGTNFKFLPELSYKYSYFIFWGAIILIVAVMLRYFRKKKWL